MELYQGNHKKTIWAIDGGQ